MKKNLKLALIDMDGTLLKGRSINAIANLGFKEDIRRIEEESKNKGLKGYEVSLKIAKLLRGLPVSELIREFEKIEPVRGAKEFISWLKSRGFITVIVTVSYDVLASRVASKLGIDEICSNKLEVIDGIITGYLEMPLGWQLVRGCTFESVCKLNVLFKYMNKYNIPLGNTLAIGDSSIDVCMVRYAKLGVAFNPKSHEIERAADIVVKGDFHRLKKVLEILENDTLTFP